MEGLIIFIIFGIIASYLSKGKETKNKSMPPFDQSRRSKVEVKTLDDFAKEIFQELNKKHSTDQKVEQSKPQMTQIQTKEEEVKKETLQNTIEPTVQKVSSVQTPKPLKKVAKNTPVGMTKKKTAKKNLPFTTSKESLVNAIIAQEVFGPPKAKQR